MFPNSIFHSAAVLPEIHHLFFRGRRIMVFAPMDEVFLLKEIAPLNLANACRVAVVGIVRLVAARRLKAGEGFF